MKKQNGITLIALIITIIVMMILVGVTVATALNGGLFDTAREAAKDTQIEADKEALLAAVVGAIKTDGTVDFRLLETNLSDEWEGTNGTYTSPNNNVFTVTPDGKIEGPDEKVNGGNNTQEARYNIAFKDLSQIDFNTVFPGIEGSDRAYMMFFTDIDGTVGSIKAESKGIEYIPNVMDNMETDTYYYEYKSESGENNRVWVWRGENHSTETVSSPVIENIKFMTDAEVTAWFKNNMGGELGDDFQAAGNLYESFTENQTNQIITKTVIDGGGTNAAEIRYDVTFKDFSTIDWNAMIGQENEVFYGLLFEDEQGNIKVLSVAWYDEPDNYYVYEYYPDFSNMDNYYSCNSSTGYKWIYTEYDESVDSSQDTEVDPPVISNVKILDAESVASLGANAFTETQINQIITKTPVNNN